MPLNEQTIQAARQSALAAATPVCGATASTSATATASRLPASINLAEGCVIAVDKPLGWTSFNLVKKLRSGILARLRRGGSTLRKVKVGHAGTLDPLASGLMVVCFGKATKDIDRLQSGVKEYTATLRLGATTPSFDLETDIDATYPTAHITREAIDAVIPSFIGTIEQTPPAFSACKVDGKRAYSLARTGKDVELKPKTLVIDAIEVLDFDSNPEAMSLTLRVVCSKGTYIRALARDIGQALGSGAHLTALRRTRVGDYGPAEMLAIDDAVDLIHRLPLVVTAPDGNDTVTIPPSTQEPK